MKKILSRLIEVIGAISFLLFLLFIIILLIIGYFVRNDIELKGKFIIGKFISHERHKKGYSNYFVYNVNGLRYKGLDINDEDGSNENLGKFYKIRYSEKFKGSFSADFNYEVTDTTEILEAGFTINDILSNKNDTINCQEASIKQEVFAIFGIEEE